MQGYVTKKYFLKKAILLLQPLGMNKTLKYMVKKKSFNLSNILLPIVKIINNWSIFCRFSAVVVKYEFYFFKQLMISCAQFAHRDCSKTTPYTFLPKKLSLVFQGVQLEVLLYVASCLNSHSSPAHTFSLSLFLCLPVRNKLSPNFPENSPPSPFLQWTGGFSAWLLQPTVFPPVQFKRL